MEDWIKVRITDISNRITGEGVNLIPGKEFYITKEKYKDLNEDAHGKYFVIVNEKYKEFIKIYIEKVKE